MRGRFRYVARCTRGHLFDEVNTRVTKEGWQVCRACDRDRKRQRGYVLQGPQTLAPTSMQARANVA